jgi:hypothetical protein
MGIRIRQMQPSPRSLAVITDVAPVWVLDTAGNGDLVSVEYTFSQGVTTLKYAPYGKIYVAFEEK